MSGSTNERPHGAPARDGPMATPIATPRKVMSHLPVTTRSSRPQLSTKYSRMRPNDVFSWIHINRTSCSRPKSVASRKHGQRDNENFSFQSRATYKDVKADSYYPEKNNAARSHRSRDSEAINLAQSSTLSSCADSQVPAENLTRAHSHLQAVESSLTQRSLSQNSESPTVFTVSPDKPKSLRYRSVDEVRGPPLRLDKNGINSQIEPFHQPVDAKPPMNPPLRASKLPSSRIGRMVHYGGLAASLGYGAAAELLRRSSSRNDLNPPQQSSLLMTEKNIDRLVSKLSQMRGAALKLGQFMSIQDSHILPEEIERIFRRVQDSAHYMPNWQMEDVMSSSLTPSWRSHFNSFTSIPSHSASIGQVHTGVLASSSSPTGKEEEVAIKIQFPKVAESISSDLGYMKLLLGASALLPKGLFLDSTIKVFKKELADECDYRREANYIHKFRNLSFIRLDSRYRVPWVWDGSTERVLVMERMKGVSVGGEVVSALTQAERNEIASRIIELCLRELFEFRMMQTDPNWTNFLWNRQTHQIELIDFGATREYSREFIDNWLGLLTAAVGNDRDACIEWSRKLGYLVGGENEKMTNAHLTSMQLLGTPFRDSTPQPFSFAYGSAWTEITKEIRAQIPVMLNNRLTPPPRETYSLNRKLSGAFLLAGRLGATVDCKSLWRSVVGPLLAPT